MRVVHASQVFEGAVHEAERVWYDTARWPRWGVGLTHVQSVSVGWPELVVGFHFFYPASVMRLVEVIEGDDIAPETVQAALNFAQAIRKTPIRCAEVPGFVVNRILNSSVAELWRYQEEAGIDIKELDKIVAESKAAPMGPFFLTDLLGLDTVLHVAEHLKESYGDRFHVHKQMKQL